MGSIDRGWHSQRVPLQTVVRQWVPLQNDGHGIGSCYKWRQWCRDTTTLPSKSIGRKARGIAWWDEDIKEMVRDKNRLFEIYLTDRNERNREEYSQNNERNEVDERDGI